MEIKKWNYEIVKPILFFTIITSFIFCFISCDGRKEISVTVIDKITKQVIDSVYVEVKVLRTRNNTLINSDYGYTNSDGKFEQGIIVGGLGKTDVYIEYHKNGYTHKIDKNITQGVVELEH